MSIQRSPLAVQLKTLDVHKNLIEGEKFIKWDEDSVSGTPVTLRVDENGFYLHWIDQNKEIDLLDIATIRDCRTGKQAKIPKWEMSVGWSIVRSTMELDKDID
ncbi:hypothetical protein O3M35_007950 [Rhynocoris fuscipes]|uniref:PLC-beta PH domain-containing protein n=1 Tax=Rhynocoris fuscipes TaxID=488301 RepID=A0AAW1DDS2_9HEMI